MLHASWRRCRVHFMRNVLAHAGKQGRRVVDAVRCAAELQRAMIDREVGMPKPAEPEPNRDFGHAPPSAVRAIFG